MDRNPMGTDRQHPHHVALRKESVDRNLFGQRMICDADASLSARRAWIEIYISCKIFRFSKSLSARRAWIEIRRKAVLAQGGRGRSPQGERG